MRQGPRPGCHLQNNAQHETQPGIAKGLMEKEGGALKGARKGTAWLETPTQRWHGYSGRCVSSWGRGKRQEMNVSAVLAQSHKHLLLQPSCTLCSGASQGGGQVVDLTDEHTPVVWYPHTEIKASFTAEP